jgi:hypothetical protein
MNVDAITYDHFNIVLSVRWISILQNINNLYINIKYIDLHAFSKHHVL